MEWLLFWEIFQNTDFRALNCQSANALNLLLAKADKNTKITTLASPNPQKTRRNDHWCLLTVWIACKFWILLNRVYRKINLLAPVRGHFESAAKCHIFAGKVFGSPDLPALIFCLNQLKRFWKDRSIKILCAFDLPLTRRLWTFGVFEETTAVNYAN